MNKTIVKYPYLTEDVEIYERENGHKIVLAHKEGELVNVSTWVKTGSINEDDSNNGISHFLEHLMFKGTHKHELHADMMLDPVLPEEEIGAPFDLNNPEVSDKRERHVVIEEIRMRKDQNWTKVYNACNFNMYKKHPYKRDVIGTPEIISHVTRDQIMDYYKTFYTPENMTTIIVGDFDKEKILEKVEKEFDFKGRKNAPKRINEIDTPADHTIVVENKGISNTSYLMIGFLGPKANQLKENIELDIISIILGESTSSRLYQNLIEKQKEPIFNMANAEHYQFKDGNNFFVQANFKPEKRDIAIELVKKEIQNLLSSRITEDELEKAKKKIKSRFAYSAETVSEIGETIGYYMTVCEDLRLIENYLTDVEDITVDDLENTIRKYLNLNNAVISILEPEK